MLVGIIRAYSTGVIVGNLECIRLLKGLDDEAQFGSSHKEIFDQLVLEVQRSLDYYDRYFSQPGVQSLVMSPTELPIPGLHDYLRESLGIPVREFDISEVLDSSEPITPVQQAQCLIAIGAVLREEMK